MHDCHMLTSQKCYTCFMAATNQRMLCTILELFFQQTVSAITYIKCPSPFNSPDIICERQAAKGDEFETYGIHNLKRRGVKM